jgi:hypothetical protein
MEAMPSMGERMDLDDAVRQNAGLKRAIEIFEDEDSSLLGNSAGDDAATVTLNVNPAPTPMDADETACPDDTMISTFSTFSAVPSMTMFANIGKDNTANLLPVGGPSPSRRGAPKQDSGNNTTNLLDFTENLRNPHKSPSKRANKSPRTSPDTSTPARQLASLIDFDIPPMPTPRSVPTITPRELESLKSNFLSEISSLKAALSGKEAEALSLKTAVMDAEKRVGEEMESMHKERAEMMSEKEEWQKRNQEMEKVLRKAKEEIVLCQKENEGLEQRLEESEKRREMAEMMHQEAESKMAGMRAGKESEKTASPEQVKSGANSARDVEIAEERVARELHGLYKSKHETKVAALKKSYEARWEKKIRELEIQIEVLNDENDKLRVGRDATMTKVDPAEAEERKAQTARDGAAIKELHADVQRLEAVVSTVQRDNEQLRSMLERERVEKGELVQLAEEMMSMQSFVGASAQKARPQMPQMPGSHAPRTPGPVRAPTSPRKTVEKPTSLARTPSARASGLKAPSGLRAPHERTKSAGGGLPRPGGVPRSGIMNSIEKMGNYRGRAGEY